MDGELREGGRLVVAHRAASFASAFHAVMNASASIRTYQLLRSLTTKHSQQIRKQEKEKGEKLTTLLTKTNHHTPTTPLPTNLTLPGINIQIQLLQHHTSSLALNTLRLQRVGVHEGRPYGGALVLARGNGGREADGGGGFVAV